MEGINHIIIDAGHGGLIGGDYQTKGKRATFEETTLYEGVANRAQAHLLNYALSLEGISSEVITTENEDISLRARCMRVNRIVESRDPESCLLISIHHNAHGNPDAHGWEIWTSSGETESDLIAPTFMRHFQKTFPEIKLRLGANGVDKDGKWTILTGTKCPALLTEDLFMTNRDEFNMITNPIELTHLVDYKVQACIDIVKGRHVFDFEPLRIQMKPIGLITNEMA